MSWYEYWENNQMAMTKMMTNIEMTREIMKHANENVIEAGDNENEMKV